MSVELDLIRNVGYVYVCLLFQNVCLKEVFVFNVYVVMCLLFVLQCKTSSRHFLPSVKSNLIFTELQYKCKLIINVPVLSELSDRLGLPIKSYP